MGVSKKKIKKQTKITNDELIIAQERVNEDKK